LWRQKSRALWLPVGDRNPKFFHGIANLHRKVNFISTIEVDGTRLESLIDMKGAICGFYKALFTETEAWRPLIDGLCRSQLRAVERESIEGSFSEEEVFKALSESCGDKAPEPNGMTMAFL